MPEFMHPTRRNVILWIILAAAILASNYEWNVIVGNTPKPTFLKVRVVKTVPVKIT